jgi:hypothetical protein
MEITEDEQPGGRCRAIDCRVAHLLPVDDWQAVVGMSGGVMMVLDPGVTEFLGEVVESPPML